MRRLWLAGAATAASLLAAGAASAAVVQFSGFETPDVAFNDYDIFDTADGWTKSAGTSGIEIQDHVAGDPAPTGGDQFVELDSNFNSSMFYTFASAGTFKIDFLFSPRPGIGPASNPISLYLNGVLLAPPGTLTGGPLGATDWNAYGSNAFNAGVGDTLLFAAEGESDSLGGYIDNITISTAVPEPATWMMMMLGFGGLGALLRRRRTGFATA